MNETQIYKCIAMSNHDSNPAVKAIAMARSPLTAGMKAQYFAELAEKGRLPLSFSEKYGAKPEQFFVEHSELEEKYGADFKKIPPGAIGVYSYFNRIQVGLQQLMAGARKFKLNLINRNDIAATTDLASKVTGIPTVAEIDMDTFDEILLG